MKPQGKSVVREMSGLRWFGLTALLLLVLLAVLLGIALWLGRPLARFAMKKFWNLHYTLVFPIFVTVREAVRMVAERMFVWALI